MLRTLALVLMALVLVWGVLVSCSISPTESPTATPTLEPSPTATTEHIRTPTPIQATSTPSQEPTQRPTPALKSFPTATQTPTATPTPKPSPMPTPNSTIPIVQVEWELIGSPVIVVNRVVADPNSNSLYALQYRWRDIPQEFWVSNDGGNSWSRVSEVPAEQVNDNLREVVAQAVISQELRSVRGVDIVAQRCDILFANIIVPLEYREQLFLIQGALRQELTPPKPLVLGGVASLAILCDQKDTFLYLVNEGKLWRTTPPSPP